MILVTGANGQTGRAIIKNLLAKKAKVRALVYNNKQAEEIKTLGILEAVVGDMMNQQDVDKAFEGVRAVYHICSALNTNEVEIGQIAINAARKAKIEHFVFHSVLHSVLQDMPHHQKKLLVEEILVNSGIPYTIIQPAVFMQNIMESWKSLNERGIFQQKFFTNQETRMCLVDLDDLAEAVSIILTNPGYAGASYELCGSEELSLSDMIAAMEKNFGRKIEVETITDEMFNEQFKKFGIGEYQLRTLLKMFHHYNEHGFVGNPKVLTWMLGRKPNDFSSFLSRTLKNQK